MSEGEAPPGFIYTPFPWKWPEMTGALAVYRCCAAEVAKR